MSFKQQGVLGSRGHIHLKSTCPLLGHGWGWDQENALPNLLQAHLQGRCGTLPWVH